MNGGNFLKNSLRFVFQFFLKFRTFFKKISMNFFHFLWCDFANRKSTVYGVFCTLLIIFILLWLYDNNQLVWFYFLLIAFKFWHITLTLVLLYLILFFIESKNKKRIKSKIVENKYYKIFSMILFLPFFFHLITFLPLFLFVAITSIFD